MILPQNNYESLEVEEAFMPSKTYRFDESRNRIVGTVDGLEAMIQAYSKMFDTDRFAYEIYTDQYGVDFRKLIGQEMDYAIATLPTMVTEALFTDNRTVDVSDIEVIQTDKRSVVLTCHVTTTEGQFDLRKEMTL